MSADSAGLVRIVRGRPTDEDLAAVIVALVARAAGPQPPAARPMARSVTGWAPVSDYSPPGGWARPGHPPR
ncbi:acyl-CoA carboxylase subunit epsilon [Rhizomonospora bruguierae]|uniref:acyl-CoA carboxylase subunit epsilon n=1 Tax=Rhizomonospora bruguierae TaxID=1581705 RepID=UPI001BD1B99A